MKKAILIILVVAGFYALWQVFEVILMTWVLGLPFGFPFDFWN